MEDLAKRPDPDPRADVRRHGMIACFPGMRASFPLQAGHQQPIKLCESLAKA